MDVIVFACQLFVGAVLFMSGLIKLLGPKEFRNTVNKYAIVPIPLEWPAVTAVVAAELIAAVALVSGEFAVVGAIIAGALFAVFIAAVGLNIRRGAELDCGCFGLLWHEKTGWSTILRDALLLALALVIALSGDGIAVQDAAADAGGVRDALPAVLAILVVVLAAWVANLANRANSAVEPLPPAPANLPPPVLTP